MKKVFWLATLAFLGVACSDSDNNEGGGGGDTSELAAPDVTISDITGTSFTASWQAVNGADEYRYEITCETTDGTTAVAAGYIPASPLTIDALMPATEYKVRIAARAEGVTSKNWFTQMITTQGTVETGFSLAPFEKYHSSGYVYPFARVEATNPEVYYWVSAVPEEQLADAASWIEEDIDYYLSNGLSWDQLIEMGLINKGDADSAPFNFADYGDFVFAVAAVGKTMSGIQLLSEPTFSYPFWAESPDTSIQHTSTIDDFAGEWMLTTAGTTTISDDNMLDTTDGEIFPVTITKNADGTGFTLEGWGGDRNRYASYALKLDYQNDSEGFNAFTISFPQSITSENGITWEYASWFIFTGTIEGEQQSLYVPYDSTMAETAPAWAIGFKGFVANENKTVVKIFGQDYTDPSTGGEGAYMWGIWPVGTNASGDQVLLNASYGEPLAFYYLTRKDVAEGKVLALPDVSQISSQTKAPAMPAKKSSETKSKRCFSRVM